jgi:hypothetical protein
MYPTTHPKVNSVVDDLLFGVKTELGEKLTGFYLFGSLASGGFNEITSDIDFVVVIKSPLSDEEVRRLKTLNDHIQTTHTKLAKKLEGSFIPFDDFKNFDPAKKYLSISTGGKLEMDTKDINAPIQKHLIREEGIALYGISPKSFIEPVTSDQLRQATLKILNNWWKPQLTDPRRLQSREYQAYAVLTMCRMLYTLQTGEITSKPYAAYWSKKFLDSKWAGLINRALSWNHEDGISDYSSTLEFIDFVIQKSQDQS